MNKKLKSVKKDAITSDQHYIWSDQLLCSDNPFYNIDSRSELLGKFNSVNFIRATQYYTDENNGKAYHLFLPELGYTPGVYSFSVSDIDSYKYEVLKK